MKRKIFASLFILVAASVFAQQHVSVPLDDPVYRVIENALIQNYIRPLPTAKPYSLATVLSALREMVQSPRISPLEKKAAEGLIARFEASKTQPWYQIGGYRYDSEAEAAKAAAESEQTESEQTESEQTESEQTESEQTESEQTESEQAESEQAESEQAESEQAESEETQKKPIFTAIEAVVSYQSTLDFGAYNKTGVVSSENWLQARFQGDISEFFSYRFQMALGVTALNMNAYAPYTYTKSWDGYQFPLDNPYSLQYLSEDPAIGLQILPEFALGLWDNKVRLNFSRVRRDWGVGDGNLMLSGTARPFMGVDFHLNPVEWFNLSFVVGVLEFNSSTGIKTAAQTFQNAYTATMLELFAREWAYFAVSSSVVWAKRFELGYGNPGMLGALYQNMIGDFDNVQVGFHFGFNVPKYLKFYGGWFIDEMKVAENFANLDRNMYSWQVGTRLAVPGAPFTTISLQYTKVEPYMYTHPDTKTPWYENALESNYLNHGEPLGYKLDPNSDELKLKVETMPLWYLNAALTYRMIRHGISADGSSFSESLDYGADLNGAQSGDLYWKDFLKDGVYEWIHSVGIEAELDLRFVNVPIAVGAGYTFYYRYLTEYDGEAGKFNRLDTFEWNETAHQTDMGNLFSIYIRIW